MFLSAATGSQWVAYLFLAIYIVMMVLIAVLTHKKSNSLNSFLLANRGLNGWMSAFAYGTTYFSSVVFVGYAGKFGLSWGLGAIWVGLFNGVIGAFLAWLVLANRTRVMTHNLGTKTMPEFFEKRYQSKHIKLLAAIIIFVFLIPYSTSVYQGLAYLFEAVFGIPFVWCVIIMAALTAAYLFAGGYFATALSDFIQGIIMIIGVALILIAMFRAPEVGGLEGLTKLTEMGKGLFPSFNASSGRLIDSPGFNLVVIILLTSFGIWALPQSVHKFYAVKNKSAIKKAVVVSTVFALIVGLGAYLNGSFAGLFFKDAAAAGGTDNVVPNMFLKANFSYALLGLIVVLVMSASMSTLSSLSLTGASAISVDLYQGYAKKNAPEKTVKLVMRIMCLVFVVVSALLAILQIDAIVTLMSLSWGALSGCFLGPYVWGLYSKKINKVGAYASMIACLVLTVVLIFSFGAMDGGKNFAELIKFGINRSPLIGVITMIVSVIITPLASFIGKKPDAEHLERCFAKSDLEEKPES